MEYSRREFGQVLVVGLPVMTMLRNPAQGLCDLFQASHRSSISQSEIPAGIVHHQVYHSALAGDDRDYFVYTPPGYDPQKKNVYPVLYLLHGYSDTADAWTAKGNANKILDLLIAQGKAQPMIVVMPLCYRTPEVRALGWNGLRDPHLRQLTFKEFGKILIGEVLPAVEKDYRAATAREERGIAGLSLGGAEALYVGLNALDCFSWVGGFSPVALVGDYNQAFPGLDDRANRRLGVLWISCGKEDPFLPVSENLRHWLQTKRIRLRWVDTPGAHTWHVWKQNLSDFVPLLFQSGKNP